MKKFIILIPVYNDWKSLIKLLEEINDSTKHFKECEFKCLIVNDASSIQAPTLKKPSISIILSKFSFFNTYLKPNALHLA